MYAEHNLTVLEMLKSIPGWHEEALRRLSMQSSETGEAVASLAVETGQVSRELLLEQIADFLGLRCQLNPPETIAPELQQILQPEWARKYGVLPVAASESRLEVLVTDPFHGGVVDELSFLVQRDVVPVVSDPDLLRIRIESIYGRAPESSLSALWNEIPEDILSAGTEDDSGTDLVSLANEAPVIRLVDSILTQAIRNKASDIHFEPFEQIFQIRYRIDGALYEMAPPPRSLAVPVISRIKVMANLNIAERRLPQDGRIKMTLEGRPVDLRVSTLPTRFGESVVLRVLDKSVVQLDLDKLTMPPDILAGVRAVVKRPNGIFIVTGPTGSGKTTTLYSALREINEVTTKIMTAEDPVEYEIDGIMQVAVNHQVGLTFARALRAFLRQDPDVIMVGEIRDLETAQIAVQASLTGHVVLSTLHTNDAPGAVTRLLDMGLEPFLISASLEAVLAQRLVRRIDPDHRVAYLPDQRIVRLLGLDPAQVAGKSFFRGAAVPANNQTGYRGRVGLFEFLRITDSLRVLINQRAPTMQLRHRALEDGMATLRESGLRAIFDGQTTVEEVLKYT